MRSEKNLYKAAGNREVMIFPGSYLYERRDKNGKGKPGSDKSKQPAWIVAGEIVQTSQLFARMVAKIDPLWVAELGAHLCVHKYSEPHYSPKTGRVLVMQRSLIHGLEVKRQQIDFGKIDAVGATQLFIRGALLGDETNLPHRFFSHNKKLREKIETTLTRVRSTRAWDIAEALYKFYEKHIKDVSSIHDLNRVVNERCKEQPDFLCATEKDLTGGDELACDLALFPDQVSIGNSVLPITYAYTPGQEDDGVTVQVALNVAQHLTSAQLQWMVPGLREEQINVLLRALPKTIRRPLMPIEPKVREIAAEFDPMRGDFLQGLAAFITQKYRVTVQASDWPPQSLPQHLQPRVEVIDHKNETVATGRDLDVIRKSVQKQVAPSDAWDRAVQRLEHYALTSWCFGDLPESVFIEEINSVSVLGYPGLALRDGEVDVRLYRKQEEAAQASPPAVRKLAELELGRDLAWLWKELRHLGGSSLQKKPTSFQDSLSKLNLTPAVVANDPQEQVQKDAHEHIVSHLLRLNPIFPLNEKRFQKLCETVRKDLPAVTHRVRELQAQVETLKQKILSSPLRYAGLEQDLQRLLPSRLLAKTPHAQLQHLPRYLRAVQVRAERSAVNAAKDADKADLIADFNDWQSYVPASQHETFRWMLEEYRVSIFAQELGTAQPVSVKRLEAFMV